MGSLTEYFGYLQAKPKKLQETVDWFSHITPTDKMKKQRREHKLYKEDEDKV